MLQDKLVPLVHRVHRVSLVLQEDLEETAVMDCLVLLDHKVELEELVPLV